MSFTANTLISASSENRFVKYFSQHFEGADGEYVTWDLDPNSAEYGFLQTGDTLIFLHSTSWTSFDNDRYIEPRTDAGDPSVTNFIRKRYDDGGSNYVLHATGFYETYDRNASNNTYTFEQAITSNYADRHSSLLVFRNMNYGSRTAPIDDQGLIPTVGVSINTDVSNRFQIYYVMGATANLDINYTANSDSDARFFGSSGRSSGGLGLAHGIYLYYNVLGSRNISAPTIDGTQSTTSMSNISGNIIMHGSEE